MNVSPFRHRARPRARRSLVLGLMTYLTLQVALAVAAERYLKVRDPMYGDKAAALTERISSKSAAGSDPVTVVMLGSSRTGYGFHGLEIEEGLESELGRPVIAFNFGVPASGPITHLVYLNRLIEAGVEPDLLLVEVLPSMLASEVIDQKTGKTMVPLEQFWFFPDRLRRRELEMVERHGYAPETTRETWRDTVLHPWYALRFQLIGRAMPGWVTWSKRFDWGRSCDVCGWGTPMAVSVTPEQYREGVERAHGEYGAVLADLKPGGGAAQALREILALSREHDIPTTLVLMPEGTDFRSWYAPHVWQRVDDFLTELGIEYRVPTIDAREWLDDSAFTDSHHMLRGGAVAFSRRLAVSEIAPRLGQSVHAAPHEW